MFLRRVCMTAGILLVLIFSANVLAEGESVFKVGAREPLTHRNTGVYGWWQPYFWEGPFDFVIVQAFVLPHESLTEVQNASDADHAKAWNENLMRARAAGKRVIAIVTPGQGKPPSDEYDKAFAAFLEHVNVDELYAVTVSEEHVAEESRHEALVNSYRRLKDRYPDLPVYQWYTNTGRGEAWPGFKWPLLPADGWIINEIFADAVDFEHEVRRYRMLGTPLIHLAWATPSLEGYPFQPSVFNGHMRVAKKYNVPCAFFCLDGYIKRRWGWHEDAKESTKKVFDLVLKAREEAQKVTEEDVSDWDNGGRLQKTILEKGADGELSYRESFDLRTKVAQKIPKHDFMERSLIKGFRHMKWAQNPTRIVISSFSKGAVDTSITNCWVTANGEYCRFVASAKITIEPKASVDVIFEVSPNGYDWIARTTKIKNGLLQVNLPTINTELYTRLRIAGKSTKPDMPLAAIDWIEVKGNIAK